MSPIKKELSDFITVAECGNFSKAADLLGVKQSGISKSIMRLEDELNTKLFMRGPRLLKLTDAGVVFYEQAIKLRNDWNLATQKARALDTEVNGKFVLAAHPVIAKYILPKVFQQALKEPGIDLDINLVSSKEAVELVREMKADFAIAVKPFPYPDLIIKPLWKEYIGLYSKDGSEQDALMYNPAMINSHEYLTQFGHCKTTAINDYQVLYSTVKRNPKSMCFLPNPIVDNEGRLKLIKRMTKTIDVCLVYRHDRLKTKGFKYLLKSIK